MWHKTYLLESNEKVTYLEKELDNKQKALKEMRNRNGKCKKKCNERIS